MSNQVPPRDNDEWVVARDGEEEVRLGRHGLYVNDGKSEVQIGRHGIRIRDKNGEVHVGGDHPMKSQRQPGGPYRSRRGLILGVCAGLARHFDMSTFWMRVLWLLVFLFTGFWPIVFIYFLAALLMKPEPVVAFRSEADAEFYSSAAQNRRLAIHRLKRTYDRLQRRIQRLESVVTSREFDWDRRIREA